ncbi:MAG: hypothetical protein DWQ01_08595 [Planctomycetota bacterium]|nr:MAG: hypothetical protein DWQ01_08595 [Planctomycetota bacterium]
MSRTGIGVSLGFGEETTFGEGVAPANSMELKGGDESLTTDRKRIEEEMLSRRGWDLDHIAKGRKAVNGTIGHDLRFTGGWLMFLSHLTLTTPTVSGTNPYIHSQNIGDTPAGILGKGLSVTVNRDGLLGTPADKAWRFYGVRPRAWKFSLEGEGKARSEWTVSASGWELVDQPVAAFPSSPWMKAPSDHATPTPSVQYGGLGSEAPVSIQGMSLNIEQPFDDFYELEASEMSEPYPNGLIKVTGSFTAMFKGTAATGGVFKVQDWSLTPKSLIYTIDGPDDTYKLQLSMPNVLVKAQDPVAAGAGRIFQTVDWMAVGAQSQTFEAVAALTNGDATPWN